MRAGPELSVLTLYILCLGSQNNLGPLVGSFCRRPTGQIGADHYVVTAGNKLGSSAHDV